MLCAAMAGIPSVYQLLHGPWDVMNISLTGEYLIWYMTCVCFCVCVCVGVCVARTAVVLERCGVLTAEGSMNTGLGIFVAGFE